MKKILTQALVAVLLTVSHAVLAEVRLSIAADEPGPVISRHIFGQFVEHLGDNVYGGIWVGPDSAIPNVRGIRTDVVAALRALRVPNVRWPGGCYAEEYHWRKGIGPRNERAAVLNTAWGNVIETNAFGTHEFFDFVEQLDAEAFLNINMASGTVQEAVEWVEYITAGQPTALAKERQANGRAEPWPVQFLGLGNESWTCGGAMQAPDYTALMKRYAMFVRSLHPEQLAPSRFQPSDRPMVRVAVGPGEGFEDYTAHVMQAWQSRDLRWSIEGLSLHHYTMGPRGPMRDPGAGFGEADYAAFIQSTYEVEAFIDRHIAVMDEYDPDRQVMLAIDEWGVWLQPILGTNPLFLKQQNSLRDAVVAALHLNMFVRNADRIRLANVAQLANVLQSMILTDGERMLLTPTYHVFNMYVPFQDATALPLQLQQGTYRFEDIDLPRVDGIAARGQDGHVYVALTNIDPNRAVTVAVDIEGVSAAAATGHVLTSTTVDAVNSFDRPHRVQPETFAVQASDGRLRFELPPKSVSVLRIE